MARRKDSTGSLRRRGPNSFEIAYRVNGVKRYETVRTDDEEVAQTVLMQRVLDARLGVARLAEGVRFEEIGKRWLASKELHLAPKTYELWEGILRCHLMPALEKDFLHQIDVGVIEDYRDAKLRGNHIPVAGKGSADSLSNQTVAHHLTVLRQIFDYAEIHKLMNGNPAKLVKKPRLPKTKLPEVTMEDVQRLLDELPTAEDRLIVVLGICLGLRIGEVLGLRVKDWNPETRQLHISGAVKIENNRPVRADAGKTDASNRILTLSQKLADQLDHQASLRQTGLLFPNQNGNPRDAGNFRTRIFKPALARAGIKDLGLHGLRHLWGSAKLSSGSPQNVVQAYGGWASAQSMSVYSHLTPHDQAQEADIASLFDL